MSDLQIILIILGAFIIAGVVVYNWLQEKKLHKQVSNEFIVPQKDVLAEDFYIDTDAYVEKELAEVSHKIKHPVFEEPTDLPTRSEEVVFKNMVLEDTVLKETPFKEAILNEAPLETSLEETSKKELATNPDSEKYSNNERHSSSTLANQAGRAEHMIEKLSEEKISEIDYIPPQLPSGIHPQIDLTAILYANKNISYQALYDMATSIDDIGLPMLIYGLDDGNKWHLVETNDALQVDVSALTFKQATCSLQLADRGGPAAKNVLNKFQFAVESMGLELNAHVEWQGSGDVLQRAIEIDQFCIEVDQLINIHVAQNEVPIHGTKFRGLAEASGMELSDDGKFYYINHDINIYKTPLFSAIEANNQAFTAESLRNSVLKAVTFQLEIPKVPNCEQAFNQMISVAQKLSHSLNASLVDDNQKPLGDLQIEKIRQQLKVIHATMVARGVMPGSPASMRLFN